jgi:MOSC domain-containing protein YiiM
MRPIRTLCGALFAVGFCVGLALFCLVPTTTHRFLSTTLSIDFVVRVHAISFNHHQQKTGNVVRLAVRKYHPQHSKPSSREYTTRKDECSTLSIQKEGCYGDYNHYRTMASQSTPNRAVSLLTCDVLESLRATYPNAAILDGDLGENILVDGVTFQFFQVGQRYCIESMNDYSDENTSDATDFGVVGKISNVIMSQDSSANRTTIERQVEPEELSLSSSLSVPAAPMNRVVLEITEPVQPCANLCKLPFINDEALTPKERIEKCQTFLRQLDQWDGYRGWYAKVIQPGTIQKGAALRIQNK